MKKTIARAALLAGMVSVFLLFLARGFPALVGGIDFPDFYCAGVLARQGVDLYNPEAQQHCQMREADRRGTYYIHPPFEALLFVPLASLSLKQAYLSWNLVGCVLLALALARLSTTLKWGGDWGLLFAASFLFPPLLLNFVQGQDSVLLVALVAVSFSLWERERYIEAGALLGLGLFKFHIVLPLALLLLIRGRWRFATGFASTAIALIGISAAFFGRDVFGTYAHFLRSLPHLPMSGVHWQAMGNVRGLVGFLVEPGSQLGTVLIALLSALLVGGGVWTWLRAGESLDHRRVAYAASVMIALLVGYHLNPHDLTLLLLPMALLVEAAWRRSGLQRWFPITVVALVFLPPIHLLLLSSKYYALMSVLVIILLLAAITVAVAREDEQAVLARESR